MSIATKRGDGGETGLAGGTRVSKSCLRVESYGMAGAAYDLVRTAW